MTHEQAIETIGRLKFRLAENKRTIERFMDKLPEVYSRRLKNLLKDSWLDENITEDLQH